MKNEKKIPNLLGISGKKRSGKNTVASIINKLVTEATNLGYFNDPHWAPKGRVWTDYMDFQEKSFAYLVKKFSSELTGIPMEGWETEEDKAKLLGREWDYVDDNGNKVGMTRRMMLKKLGSDACNQNLHPNVWVNGVFQDFDQIKSKWLVTDVRFPQEVEAIKSRHGIVIRVVRPSREDGDKHISETALDDYKGFDYVIVNDGTLEELEEKVRKILEELDLI